jgi:hypothetical protein
MNRNKDKTINSHRQAIAGVQKHFASTPSLVLDGTPTTPNDVIATLQGAIDAIDAAAATEKAFHDKVTAQHAAIAKGNALLRALRMLVQNQLGSTQGALGDFGFSTRARQIPTEEAKAAAAAKRKATRELRHTMGSRQKAKVKSEVSPPPPPAPIATKPT